MSKFKAQAFRDATLPTSYTDFRGDKWLGHGTDEHRTIVEMKGIASEDVDQALIVADQIRALVEDLPKPEVGLLALASLIGEPFDQFTNLEPDWAQQAATLLGLGGSGPVRIGGRFYDDDK